MSKSAKKLKKPLDLPLGKATSYKDVDLSHVRLPIDTSVFGLKHALTLFETATNEVKSYLAYECDLMYECRICRTIFRSIANFILHKRKFCREKYNTPRDPGQSCQETYGVTIIQRDIEIANQIVAETEPPDTKKVPGSSLNPIIENLLKRHEQKKLVEDMKNENSTDLPKIEEEKKIGDLKSISLEKIEGSDVAVFQTMEFGPKLGEAELMKSEVMEIHSIFDRNEAVLGSNGEILTLNPKEKDDKHILKNDYLCTECNTKFSTKKTLACHVKYKHSQNRLVYPCPVCKDNLSNAWSVYRHLLKIHRMTSNQIRKYRTQINNSAIFRKSEENKDKRKNPKEHKEGNDQENEWLDNVEGDSDLQMCGGCGKHFERKAALMSHSVMCIKRIAVCNSIKENNSRKKESENGDKFKSTQFSKAQHIGSAKRKSSNVIMYKPKNPSEDNHPQINNTETSKEDELENKEEGEIVESLVVEEHDSDVENTDEWMKKDIQQYDKDKLMSIIGVDTGRNTPTSDQNTSSKLSDRSDSPCRGFEAETSENTDSIVINDPGNYSNSSDDPASSDTETNSNIPKNSMTDPPKDIPNDLSDSKVVSGVSENTEEKIVESEFSDQSSSSNSKTSTENEMDVSSDISLDNKISCDFKLDLCEDPNFIDVSIKPLIREIIDEDVTDSDIKNPQENVDSEKSLLHKVNGLKTIENDVTNSNLEGEEKFNNNNTGVIVETKAASSSKIRKRKRSDSSNSEKIIRASIPKLNQEKVDKSEENKAFVSKISPFIDKQNLTCSLCNNQFVSLSELLLHMSNHFSWYRFQCSKCLFMSFNKNDCEKHVRKDHKLPLNLVEGSVLPIPTWKASLISDNFMHLESLSNEKDDAETLGTDTKIDEDKSINYQTIEIDEDNASTSEVELCDPLVIEADPSTDLGGYSMDLSTINVGENNILGYIDLTLEENLDDCVETADNSFLLMEETDAMQDLSKQAIMEVILGNDHKKDNNVDKCEASQSCEHVRPLRNRTKSIKASQKDFIYDFDTPKSATLKAFNSRSDTEQINPFEVLE
ncbi:uncharacterized protein LOC123315521 [Coccinella septempunctata]|uniref:uncharacterized protein LOC123315521 n=1 Tax=Coccinella septempunctata TaxID=41139 RepID=UPI001D066830|nr:uncharacterized protein LOC123315521 [Coccinella septempunctata]XP_044757180.1 uncharacterized protein LOC123315521 [Coccinella septempunctata]